VTAVPFVDACRDLSRAAAVLTGVYPHVLTPVEVRTLLDAAALVRELELYRIPTLPGPPEP